ncbi:MAG: Adaptive-response sensory-kinase SasA [Eubacteriales bacterium SKADARSKE-1]|nr:Adaptive-response sensory-kinase SasA [Eubacteriales bacterium SKADARSKE-1]
MFFKGITKRWFFNCFGAIVLILIIVECVLAFFIQSFFYNSVEKAMIGRANGISSIFLEDKEYSETEFSIKIRNYIINFQDENIKGLIAFNSRGEIITATGSVQSEEEVIKDYNESKNSEDNIAFFTGNLSSGEKVMTVTKSIVDQSGKHMGAIRYITPLEAIDNTIFWAIFGSILVGVFVVLFVVMASSFFIKSIVTPIREVSKTSRRIALGDFNARLTKRYDDEIGELCDTVNYMAQKLSESEKMKNDFISSISHELRTPLTAIKGWAETIQMSEEKDIEMNKKGLNIIVHESERLCGLVEELLDFSRMQSGRIILNLDKIDILAEISEAVYMFRERAAYENKILLYSEPEMLSPVLGDKARLKQVFINIIDNALKYTPSGGVINVGVREEHGFINIMISDNGCGIPENHLPHVRDKFYKANKTQGGSGIGLAVANELVLLHSGTLDIKSEENIGTVITISIPVADNNQENDQIMS